MAKTKKLSGSTGSSKISRSIKKQVEKPIEESIEKKQYCLSILVNDNRVELNTDNLLEALIAYPVPAIIKTEMLVTVTKGTKIRDITLKTFESRRIFGNRNALEIFADKLVNLIG